MWCRLRMRMTRFRSVREIYVNSSTCTMEEMERLSQQIEAPPQVERMISGAVKFSDKSSSSKKMKAGNEGSKLKMKKKVKKYHILSPSSKKQTSEKSRENRAEDSNKPDKACQSKNSPAIRRNDSSPSKATNTEQIQRNQAMLNELVLWIENDNNKDKDERHLLKPELSSKKKIIPSEKRVISEVGHSAFGKSHKYSSDTIVGSSAKKRARGERMKTTTGTSDEAWMNESNELKEKAKKAARMEVGAEPLKIVGCDGQSRRAKGNEKLRSPIMKEVYKTAKNTISGKDFTKAGVNIKSVSSLTAPLEIGKMTTNNPSPFRSRSKTTPSAEMTEGFPRKTSFAADQMSLSCEQQLVCDGLIADSPISGISKKSNNSTAVFKNSELQRIKRVSKNLPSKANIESHVFGGKCNSLTTDSIQGAPSNGVCKLERRGFRMDSDADTKTSKAAAEKGFHKIQDVNTQKPRISLPHGINGSGPNNSVMSVHSNPYMTYISPPPAPREIDSVNSNGPNMMLLGSFLQMAYNNPHGASSYNLPSVVAAPNMISITNNCPSAALPAAPSNYLTLPNPNASFTLSLPASPSAPYNPTPIIRPIVRRPGRHSVLEQELFWINLQRQM